MGRKAFSTIFISIIILLSACSNQLVKSTEEEANDKLEVYASVYPMYDFAKKIGKDRIKLRLMIPPGAEPHDWEPTAKLMAQMESADVLIYNGAQLEMWVDKVIGSLSNENLIAVETTKHVKLRSFHEDEENDHNKEHNHGQYDPHVWLDPIKATEQAESIKNAFIKADKENEDFYERNYNELVEELEKLDKAFKEELKDRKTNYIVVAHGAFGYLSDRYGLEQINISGLTPQEEPSAAKIGRISEIVKEHEIEYIFFEPLTNPKLAEVIAKETGAKTAVLNPLGGLTEEDINLGKDYISVMKENLEALKRALQ